MRLFYAHIHLIPTTQYIAGDHKMVKKYGKVGMFSPWKLLHDIENNIFVEFEKT